MDKQSRKELKEQYKSRKIVGGIYAIRCSETGECWIRKTIDLQGSINRFAFFCSTDACPEGCMRSSWKEYGAETFSIEVMEELEKKELQTRKEFADDIEVLLEIWQEKIAEQE